MEVVMSSTGSINGSGSLSSADFYTSMFKKLDENGDGKITKAEFEKAQAKMGISVEDADKLFSQVDTDSDGSISSTENETFLKNHKPSGPPPPPPSSSSTSSSSGISLTDLFAQTDSDGDGILTESEQQAYLKKVEDAFKQLSISQNTYNAQGQGTASSSQIINTQA
jgi:Ca2+-binding EF-hand superfamily protein